MSKGLNQWYLYQTELLMISYPDMWLDDFPGKYFH